MLSHILKLHAQQKHNELPQELLGQNPDLLVEFVLMLIIIIDENGHDIYILEIIEKS